MNSSYSATSYCASPALATLYAPPRTRVAQVFETVPGWRGFGHVQRIAIVANAFLLALLAGLMALFTPGINTGATLVLWTAALCALPLLNLLSLWPCRTWRPLRALMMLANLATFGTIAALMATEVRAIGLLVTNTEGALIVGTVILAGLLPSGAALWAQIGAWRRG